jgi:hypothetical protein
VSSDVCKLILGNLQVRWSSPLLFNDPFDTQLEFKFGFEIDEFAEAFKVIFEELVYAQSEPVCDTKHPMCAAIHMLRRIRHKLNKIDFLKLVKKALDEGAISLRQLVTEEHSDWLKYLKSVSLFCVAEAHDDLLMWAHYANCHTGAVVKFKCLPEKDTALCAAKPVIYQKEMPTIASLTQWVDHSIGQKLLNTDGLFCKFAFAKSDHWTYEKEWRCFSHNNSGTGELFEMVNVHPEEIQGIYLGCKISPGDKDEILSLLTGDLARAEVYQGKKNDHFFKLDFDRIV